MKVFDYEKENYLTVAFIISLLPMLMNQYGGLKGVQEIPIFLLTRR